MSSAVSLGRPVSLTRNLPRFLALVIGMLANLALLSPASGQLVISEFQAANQSTLADQDGEFSDWLEIYNASAQPVDLGGWFLANSSTNLGQWRFPALNLSPNEFLVVFASAKDRATAGSELHTNFRLASAGEFLALVKPDGKTVVSSFQPAFPPQVADVSFGIAMQPTVVPLISSGAAAKWLVPRNDLLGAGWTDPDWSDAAWAPGLTGVGYASQDGAPALVVVADSAAEFSGRQGWENWFYGYYDKTGDRTLGYQIEDFVPFPKGSGPYGASNFWNGLSWEWFGGDPPWTEIGPSFMHPNGSNSGFEHWAVRRWISEVTGPLTVRWHVAKLSPFGSGVTARLYHQGVQKDLALLAGDDLAGLTRTIAITNVQSGDCLDFAVAPTGTANASDDRFDATQLTASIQATTTLAGQIRTSVESAMRSNNATIFLRVPFTVTRPSTFEFLILRLKYDDGFVAYLNGVEVARAEAPETPAWNSTSTASRDPAEAFQFADFDLSNRLGLLHAGTNLLAIQGLNASIHDSDFLLLPELLATESEIDVRSARYCPLPAPGVPKGLGKTKLGALIVEARHLPQVTTDDQDLFVTARAVATFDPVVRVTLFHRVMFGAEVSLEMKDDGWHGDGAAGDGLYGAAIPATASSPGQMIRYYFNASDAKGRLSRWPLYPDPKNSPQYAGTIVADPALTNALPVLHWFVQSASAADNSTGTRCSVFFQNEFYDNVAVNLHCQSSAQFPKKSYDFDFNRGSHFRYDLQQRRVDDFNLLTTYPDKSHLRNLLAYETYRDAGSPSHVALPLRVQRNGLFYSDAHFVEDGDDVFLARLGLNPKGALYKMYNTLESATTGVEKKNRKNESNADLQALITGTRRTGTARVQYFFDNIDIPAMVNYLAAMIITGGIDCCHKNYYAYRDTEGTGEWQFLPWDVDLTFGRNWNSASTYYDDVMYANNSLFIGSNNALISALFGVNSFRLMYLQRVRTLMDELLQSTNTPVAELKYERRIDVLATLIGPDAALDYAKWATWGQKQTLPTAVNILKNVYLPARRRYLATLREIPTTTPTNAMVTFGALEFNPTSGRQAEEFIQLTNQNTFAVDLSGWKLTGPIEHTFRPGTVLPPITSIHVSPDVVAFRARSARPSGGQGLLVQGPYRGQLPARGATVRLLDRAGREVRTLTYAGRPTLAQQFLRVTEILYHPVADQPGSAFNSGDFEFLELKNIGPEAFPLGGIHFTNGIQFTFPGAPAAPLMPGHSLWLVKNPAAFISRYGIGFNLAGPYEGSLSNAGESLRLDDAGGETILEFTYKSSWYPATDGQGFSLVIADEKAPWSTWGEKGSWRSGSVWNGSPAQSSPNLTAWRARYFTAAELGIPALSADDADPDADHFSNRQEFLSGTDPRDRQSHLRLESATWIGGTNRAMQLRFQAAAGKSYSVQFSAAPAGLSWQKLADVPRQSFARPADIADSVTPQSTARYYRLVTPMQP